MTESHAAARPCGFRSARTDPAASPGVLAPPPLFFLGGWGAGYALHRVLGTGSSAGPVARAAGVTSLVAGGALAVSFVVALRRARTPIDPRHAATAVVTGGPYRLTRNPGYLGMALAYAGAAAVTGTWWALATLVPVLVVVDRCVVAPEERHLTARFGEEYLRYRARVRRWL